MPQGFGGCATVDTSTLAVGTNRSIATHGVAGNFTGNTSAALTQTVDKVIASALVSSANPSVLGG